MNEQCEGHKTNWGCVEIPHYPCTAVSDGFGAFSGFGTLSGCERSCTFRLCCRGTDLPDLQ